jgi:thiol-disulfide isomerase/thioredoxin
MLKKTHIFLWVFLILTTLFSSAWADEGKPLDLTPYKGKVVLVDFWPSWCPPCRESFPWLNKISEEKAAQGLIVLGVNVDEDSQDAKQFLVENKAIFNTLYDPTAQYASYYKLVGMPTTLIFDRQGKLAHQHSGFEKSKTEDYEQAIDQVLAH